MRRSRSARCWPYGRSAATVQSPVASSSSESWRTSRIASDRPWPSTGSSYPPASPSRTTPVSVGFLAPGLLAAERRARPGRCGTAQASCGRDRSQPGECLEEALRPGTSGPPRRLLVRMAVVQAQLAAALREDIELNVSFDPDAVLVVWPSRRPSDEQASNHVAGRGLADVDAG